nr:SRPBCC family protein [uncultured Oscillibacter sp.]
MTEKIVSTMGAVVPHSVEKVWAVVTDLDRWQWRGDLEGLERTGPDTFTEYARGGFPTRFTVTCRQEPVKWAFDLENANMSGSWTGEFQTVPEGTRVTFTERLTPKKWWMKFLMKGYLRKQQAQYFADLRRALE